MAKNSYSDWDSTAGNNTDVGGINIAENCAAANINNALREMMGQLATYQVVGRTATQTLTNKTLTSPTLTGPTTSGTVTFGGATLDILINDGQIGWAAGADYVTWVSTEGFYGYENNTFAFRIGSNQTTRIPSIYANTTANAASVHVNVNGDVLRSTSSGEFKIERSSVDPSLILRLNPVSFKSTHEEDEGRRFTGFIAEDVAEAFPEASIDNGKNYDVRAIVAALAAMAQDHERRLNAIEEGQ